MARGQKSTSRREEMLDATKRDLSRMGRRKPHAGFFQYLALIGSVGWPIVLFAVAGGIIGHRLDLRFGFGGKLAASLLLAATALGVFVAFRSVRGGRP